MNTGTEKGTDVVVPRHKALLMKYMALLRDCRALFTDHKAFLIEGRKRGQNVRKERANTGSYK